MFVGVLTIQAATASAQSQDRPARLPQSEELRVSPPVRVTNCAPPFPGDGPRSRCPNPVFPQVIGAWNLTFTPTSGNAQPFSSLATFGSDGVFTNTAAGIHEVTLVLNNQIEPSNGPRAACYLTIPPISPSASPGVGVWVGWNNEVIITFAHLLYDGWGQHVGMAKVRASLTSLETENTVSGRYVTDLYDNNGQLIIVFKGTVSGQRLFVESMPPGQ
jgi:hypothetical protein